ELVLTEGGIDTRIDLSTLSNAGGNNQVAAEVPFTPSAETTSTNVQDAIDELQVEITGISANGTNPNDELNQIFEVNGTNLEITDAGGTLQIPLANINTDNQQLTLNDDFLTLEDGGTPIDLSIYDNSGTDNQQLNLTNNLLTLENGGTPIDLTPYDNQDLSLTGNILNITNGNGVDLTPILGQTDTDDQDLTLTGNILNITDGAGVDLTPILGQVDTDDQDLSLVGNILNITDGAGVDLTPLLNSADEQDLSLSGNFLNITNGVGVDLTPILGGNGEINDGQNVGSNGVGVFSTKNGVTLEFKNINAGSNKIIVTDDIVNNEIDIDINDVALQITEAQITDLNHTVNTDDQNAVEVPFTPYITLNAIDTQKAIEQLKDELDEAIIAGGGTDDQNIEGSILVDQTLTIGIESGNNQDVDVSALATDTEVANAIAASEALDLDIDPANELQAITSTDNSVTITPNGNDFDLSVVGGTDAQNIEGSVLVDQTLTIGIEGGNNQDVDVSALATDTEVVNLVAASEALDLDIDPANELQNAVDVPFSAVGNTTSDNVQSAIQELQIEIDGLSAGNTNLSNSNLIQTDAIRTYEIEENESLVFTGLGNIGFGNAANPPLSKFHFAGEIRVEGVNSAGGTTGSPAYSFSTADDSNTGMYRPAADQIGFSVGGFEAMRLDEVTTGQTDVIINQTIDLDGDLLDVNDNAGTAGQILSSTGTGVQWITPAGGAASVSWADIIGKPAGFVDDTDNVDDADNNPANELVSGLVWQESTQELQLYQAASFIGVNLTGLGPDFGAQDITTTGNLNVGGTVTVGGTQVHPDYVFEKYFNGVSLLKNDYEFMPLLQLEAYLKKYHHLPGIKSAAQVIKEQSWDLGASNIQNLEKIEELFLHTIEQEKKLETLKAENDSLAKELNSMKKDLEMIKSLLLTTKKGNE
ncbi:MAG: bZIP transcription factor, partial [Croceitalea sp.]|nr:bZIP transcription factor [Croceitalea sp.]